MLEKSAWGPYLVGNIRKPHDGLWTDGDFWHKFEVILYSLHHFCIPSFSLDGPAHGGVQTSRHLME